ncbi:hypothetical protein ElyMa_005122700 [Elysia marginata]|uniref:Uncharacterized protein n=1 Tax=Elysia marginata TaxID=1093978 RepID=A0AAV4JJN6_9GAST|nr:hypothetical protein ElyMa_005122700 [Elysia marginata]
MSLYTARDAQPGKYGRQGGTGKPLAETAFGGSDNDDDDDDGDDDDDNVGDNIEDILEIDNHCIVMVVVIMIVVIMVMAMSILMESEDRLRMRRQYAATETEEHPRSLEAPRFSS